MDIGPIRNDNGDSLGEREFFLNREPLETHIRYAAKFGFDIMDLHRDYEKNGLPVADLEPKFREFDPEDLRARGAVLILRKQTDG
jgi:hypothetical protein